MELDLEIKQQLAELLAKPTLVTQAHAAMLADLTKAYPYYQPLHLLLAKASLGSTEHEHQLATAALYNNGSLLHQIIYRPDSLTTTAIEVVHPLKEEQVVQADEQEIFDEIAELTTASGETTTIERASDELETFDEIAELENLPAQAKPSEEEITEDIAEQPADEQETFDEIAELDAKEFVSEQEETEVQAVANTTAPETAPIADDMAIGSIVATDFFAFEKSFKTEQGDLEATTTKAIAQPEEYDQEAEDQTVSKYNDDKLPYTFLWWLAKTRKEHEQIFQPYVTPKNTEPAPHTGDLQHQYVEHIFHIQTPFNANEAGNGELAERPNSKGDEIIEAFIKSEPQIGPPKPEQINNENKAKKSAEDNYDLVSETLASIYIEQMLYHKAIDTYEKLSLKFPEKSRYFADLIQSLEKKI
ncbi:hypothetical protein VRU48_13355 [Pedobacter sp. KR3-3]|uniref:Tetratricopeptide repeat protein n=1 Tax=Pedobacter albus TaxID=3113905 RepID=A0ABU7I9I1_9SPHI|nr:hypothetical protein [Pedobacter sp. KR3-3]MEE1946103.1 hypothetical protein [Pedobacter sp. KR3-3]